VECNSDKVFFTDYYRAGRGGAFYIFPSISRYDLIMKYETTMGSWLDDGNGTSFSVDFSSRSPTPGRDYYLVVGGNGFTLEVTNNTGKLRVSLADVSQLPKRMQRKWNLPVISSNLHLLLGTNGSI
jgi:hypothetical protein